jgi:hypothetical protein
MKFETTGLLEDKRNRRRGGGECGGGIEIRDANQRALVDLAACAWQIWEIFALAVAIVYSKAYGLTWDLCVKWFSSGFS